MLSASAHTQEGRDAMALIRLRATCEAGNVCETLILDTDTGDVLVQAPVDHAAAAALSVPDGEVVSRIRAHLVPQLLYGLGPHTGTDTSGLEVLA